MIIKSQFSKLKVSIQKIIKNNESMSKEDIIIELKKIICKDKILK